MGGKVELVLSQPLKTYGVQGKDLDMVKVSGYSFELAVTKLFYKL